MSRRDFIKTGASAVVGLGALSSSETSTGGSSQHLPKVLIIHTDQRSSWTLSMYGGNLIDTPSTDPSGVSPAFDEKR
jgi:hypothetical protein